MVEITECDQDNANNTILAKITECGYDNKGKLKVMVTITEYGYDNDNSEDHRA